MIDETMESSERNLEKEKETFEEAINRPVIDIPTDFDIDASNLLIDDLVAGKVFVLGEIHGVRENPSIVYTLIKRFKFTRLGMEWDKGLGRVTQLFMDDGVLDFNSIKNSSDGRISAGYFALLKKLKAENLGTKTFFFDDKDSWTRRDEAMAEEIIGHTADSSPTIAIAGRAHADLADIREGDGTMHPSMVKFLEDKGKPFCNGEIRYLSGRYFSNQSKNFENVLGGDISKARFYRDEFGVYIFELPTASLATVPNPTGIYIE